MNTKKALMIFPVIVVLLVVLALALQRHNTAQTVATSNLAKVKVQVDIVIDDWFHYSMLCSPHVVNPMRSEGYPVKCHNDKGKYLERYTKLAESKATVIVGTVDSLLSFHETHKWRGVKVATLDVSDGSDALVTSNKFLNLDDLKGKVGLRIAYTPGSPSDTFRKGLGMLFVPELFSTNPNEVKRAKSVFIETNGSEEALRLLEEGKADAAFLWEPHVSMAVAKGFRKIIGSDELKGLIVDDLVIERSFAQKYPNAIRRLLFHYFTAMEYYGNHPDEHIAYLQKATGTKEPEAVKTMLKGIIVPTLHENCTEWFGVSVGGKQASWKMVDSIEETVRFLRRTGDLTNNPIPQGDAASIIDNSFLRDLCTDPDTELSSSASTATDIVVFKELTPDQWKGLIPVGTLKERTISFDPGSNMLTREGQIEVGEVMRDLARTPTFRLRITGHAEPIPDTIRTSEREAVNVERSRARAQVVFNTLKVLGVPEERMHVVGRGSYQPTACWQDEKPANCAARSRRVEFELLKKPK